MLNPIMNIKECTIERILTFLFSSGNADPSDSSLKDTPVKYEMYVGIRGNIQGDRNINSPAIKLTAYEMFDDSSIPLAPILTSDYFRQYDICEDHQSKTQNNTVYLPTVKVPE